MSIVSDHICDWSNWVGPSQWPSKRDQHINDRCTSLDFDDRKHTIVYNSMSTRAPGARALVLVFDDGELKEHPEERKQRRSEH